MHRLAAHPAFTAIPSFMRRISSRRVAGAWLLTLSLALLVGCGMGPNGGSPVAAKLDYQGKVQGGQQPVTGSLIQLYAVGTTGDGSSATPLISAVVTTSDGTGNAANSNANAGNGFNALPAGAFNITGAYTCPSPSEQVYLVATGGNPGLASGMSNPVLAMMAALGRCGDLGPTTSIFIDELTTVGSIAPLAQYMGGYASLGSSPANATQLVAAMNLVRQYTNTGNGTVPGPDLQPGYYASQLEVTTLGDILAACVNSSGGEACTELFRLTTPPGGSTPTDTIGAAINIIKYPANNATAIYNLLPATAPFQPTLSTAPATWSLPIVPIAATPVISPAGGTYSVAPTITITTASTGATIRYTTDGSTPTAASKVYTAPFTLPGSGTVRAIASGGGFATSAVASATYTLPAAGTPQAIAFIVQPATRVLGTGMSDVRVGLVDAYGTLVATQGINITIALGNNPSGATLTGTKVVATGRDGTAVFSGLNLATLGAGYTLVASTSTYGSVTSTPFDIVGPYITVTPFSSLVGIGSTLTGKVTLATAAPAGGVTVSLTSSDSGKVSVTPSSVTVAAGSVTGNFTYTGVAPGLATITALGPGYSDGGSDVTATNAFVNLGTLPTLTPGGSASLNVTLSQPASAGGVTVSVTSGTTSVATVSGTAFFPANSTVPSSYPTLTGVSYGSTVLTATASAGFAPDIRTLTLTNGVTLTATARVQPYSTVSDTLTLSSPAPAGGLVFTLTSDKTAVATVPSTVTVAAGATTANFNISGVGVGSATIKATRAGLPDATTAVTVYSSTYVQALSTGVKLQTSTYAGFNATPGAPSTFTLTSSNPAVLLLSPDANTPGAASITLTATTSGPVLYYQQGVSSGTATVSLASDFGTASSSTSTVYPSTVVLTPANAFATTTVSADTTISVRLALLLNAYTVSGCNGGIPGQSSSCYVAPGAGLTVPLTNSNPAFGTLASSSVTFATGSDSASTSFHPVAAGTTNIGIGVLPAGFTANTVAYNTIAVGVTAPTFTLVNSQEIAGVGVYVLERGSLSQTPANPVTVTVTSGNPNLILVSSSVSSMGGTSASFAGVTGTIPIAYIQGVGTGSTTITYSSPGYTSSTIPVVVTPAGLTFDGTSGTFGTTTASANGLVGVILTILDNTLTVQKRMCTSSGQLICGLNPNVTNQFTLVSSNPSAGTVTPNPFALPATSLTTLTFQPVGAGTGTLTFGPSPSPLSTVTYSTYGNTNFSVTQAVLNAPTSTTGSGLYAPSSVGLTVAPGAGNPKTLTLTSSNPAVAILSTSATTLGSASISFPNLTNTAGQTYYVQGFSVGTSTLTVSAPGYSNATSTITVLPSGVVFASGGATFNTTAFATPRTLTLYLALLNPATGALQSYCNSSCFANPGSSLSVPVMSSNPAIGTISASPVVFAAGTSTTTTTFVPNDVGQTTIALGTPSAGLSTSTTAGTVSGVATVTGDYIDVSPTITGEGVYTYKFLSLPSSPGSYPITVTVALADQSLGRLSTSETTMGTSGSLTFTLNSGVTIGMIYIQGVASGNTTLLMSARGYNTGRGAVQVMKTGITFLSSNAAGLDVNLGTTTTGASAAGLVSLLDPVSLAWISDCTTMIFPCKVNPGHSTDVTFGTANGSVASFSTTPVSINTSTGLVQAPITVVGNGVTDFGIIQQPTGWVNTSTPYRSTGRIVVGDATHLVSRDVDTAIGLQVQTAFTLSGTNYESLSATFTATVADPTVAALSTAFGTAGGTSVSAYGTGALGFTFYVQGKKAGTTTITFSGGGYTPRTVTVRVNAAGFVLKGPDMFRKLTSGNQSVLITPAVLNASQQWIADAVTNPGSSLGIPMSSSDTSVGTIVTSPVALTGAVSGVNALFHPVAVGTTILSVGTPTGFTAPTSYSTINATVQ